MALLHTHTHARTHACAHTQTVPERLLVSSGFLSSSLLLCVGSLSPALQTFFLFVRFNLPTWNLFQSKEHVARYMAQITESPIFSY